MPNDTIYEIILARAEKDVCSVRERSLLSHDDCVILSFRSKQVCKCLQGVPGCTWQKKWRHLDTSIEEKAKGLQELG